MVTDRDEAVAAWRSAEARVYPTVMVNAALYEQYVTTVRAIAEQLGDVRTDEALVDAWHERRDVATEVVSRSAPSMRAFMDMTALRDAAFCHRHRQISRERAKDIARERLAQARRTGADWVVLFEDVTPLGSQRLEMHVRTTFELEVVQLDPATGAWLVDKPPLMPARTYHAHEEWEARIQQARTTFGGGTT
jgi:hypothetical protein